MPTLLLRDVVLATGGSVGGEAPEMEFSGVSTDTREIEREQLYVALKGSRFDGHQFLGEAARRGAAAAMVESTSANGKAPLTTIRVDSTRFALAELARYHGRRNKARPVAITGSNGKTTTKDILQTVLSAAGATVASPYSFNNEIGVPRTLLSIEPETEFAVVELGTNAPGEIAGLAALANPEVGIITNCTYAHVKQLGDLDGVIAEKGSLLEALPREGVAILNADDPALEELSSRCSCPVVTFGIRNPADFRATNIRFDLHRLTYQWEGERIFLPLGGCHNVYNSLAALAASSVLGVPRHVAVKAIRETKGQPMRLGRRRVGPIQVLDDTYNANPGSVEAAFRTLGAAEMNSRKVVILGDMKELGEHAPALHRQAGGWVSVVELGLLVAVGRFAEYVREGALEKGFPEERIHTFASTEEAAEHVPRLLRAQDTVLIKGSRAMAMERLVYALEAAGGASAG